MIRNINYRDLSKSCFKEKIYVKAFPGADVSDMQHYSMPTVKRDPNTIIIHCGANILQDHDSPDALAQEIIDLATSLKSDDNKVIISSMAYCILRKVCILRRLNATNYHCILRNIFQKYCILRKILSCNLRNIFIENLYFA